MTSMARQAKVQGGKNIEVAVRMRPLLQQFEDQQIWQINHEGNKIGSIGCPALSENININNSFQGVKTKKKTGVSSGVERNNRYEFVYDHAFGPVHKNSQIYEQCCQGIIEQFSQRGRNGTIFMYGQTTSGKTFTMLGDNEVKGIIWYSLKDICDQVLVQPNVKLCISYFEIYNEQINDLLNPGSTNLKIIEDKVHGAKECDIKSFMEVLNLLQLGQEQRSYSEKSFHDHSSRSHTIFQVKRIEGKSKALLNLVDLAGSERLTDEDSNQETGYINKSLFVLSNVIHRLASGKKNVHVPYRDSKLTRLLAPSLSGHSLTTVICTVSPASVNFYQTLSTLRFAACSRKVQLKPFTSSPQVSRDQSFLNYSQSKQLTKLRQENEKLKRDISNLSFVRQTQQTFMQNKVRHIGEHLHKTILPKNWENKVEMLCLEYKRNVETLQKEYTKALINAVCNEYELKRETVAEIVGEK